MSYVEPVINDACKEAQTRRLESQSKASRITVDQAIAQTKSIQDILFKLTSDSPLDKMVYVGRGYSIKDLKDDLKELQSETN
jgi:hypothetical protein